RPFVNGRFVGPAHFFHPFFAFRPRFNAGFGLWGGWPIAYPYAFYNPFYYYPYYSGGYPNYSSDDYLGSDNVYSDTSSLSQPDQSNMGGLSFIVTPDTAEIFVDGMRVGTVGEFNASTQPLGLQAGHHHVDLRAPGYHTASFDVDIVAGQVIPYQG